MTLTPLDALDSTYESINRGIHRRTASIVGIPSVARHLGLWNVKSQATAREVAYDKYLEDLKAVIREGGNGTIHFVEEDLSGARSGETVRSGMIRLIRFWWHGIRAKIRVEFRTEYVMITSILDLSLEANDHYQATAGQFDAQAIIRDKLGQLGLFFNAADENPNRQKQVELFQIARFLQYDLWKEFETSVLDAGHPEPILGDNFGHVFATSAA